MTRPIIWATGTLVAIALSASLAGGHLSEVARRFRAPSPPPGPQAGSIAPNSPERVLVLQSDGSGHFLLHPQIDGLTVRMLVDTCASLTPPTM